MQTNAADEKQVKDQARNVRFGREQDLEDVKGLLFTKSGRRFMWRILSFCKVFETSFTGNSTTFFNEGMRNVGLMLLADITESSPESYLTMIKEARESNVK
jgi:hypothetical protein